jgi:hypothetical protein
LFNGVVALFADHSLNGTSSNYTATINWGDGSVGQGIVRGLNGSFLVYGSHKYSAGTTYPVDVTINASSSSGYAWSIAELSGVPRDQPPFPQAHITGELSTGHGAGFLDEEVTLVNTGNLPSAPIFLKFYLSPTSATQPIDPHALPLQIGKNSIYEAVSIPAGGAISGAVSDIIIPAGAVTRDKYIIMQVITSDPVGSHMYYPRAFADGPLVQ